MRRTTAERREGAYRGGALSGCTAEETWAVLGKGRSKVVLQRGGRAPVLGKRWTEM